MKKIVFFSITTVALFAAAILVYVKGSGGHLSDLVREEIGQGDSTEVQTDGAMILGDCFYDENRPDTMSLEDFMTHHKKQLERIEAFWDQQSPDNSLSCEAKIQALCKMQQVRIEQLRSSPVAPDMVEGNISQEGLSRFQIDHHYYTLIQASEILDEKESLMHELNCFMHVAIPLSEYLYQVAVLEYFDGSMRPIIGTEVSSEVFELQNSLLQSNIKRAKRLTNTEIEQFVQQLERFIADPPEEYEGEKYQDYIEHQHFTVENLQRVREAMLDNPPVREFTDRIKGELLTIFTY